MLKHIALVLRYTQLAALALVLGIGALLWSETADFEQADGWVARTHEVIRQIDEARQLCLRTGVLIRNYIITEDPTSLQQVRELAEEGLRATVRLQALTQDNPVQRQRAEALDVEMRRSMGWLLSAVVIAETDGAEPVRRIFTSRLNRGVSRPLREGLDRMEAEEQRLLQDRFADYQVRLTRMKRLGWAVGAGLIAFLAWSLLYSSRLLRLGAASIAELTDDASRDPLTGLLNRRALLRGVPGLDASAGYAVLAFDLDRFKPINDRFGHAVGDDVLREVARRVRQLCRDDDLIARIGGDEFVVVLPALTDRARVTAIAARLREAVEQPMAVGPATVSVAASIGTAFSGADGDDFESVLEQADGRSYAAKPVRRPVDPCAGPSPRPRPLAA